MPEGRLQRTLPQKMLEGGARTKGRLPLRRFTVTLFSAGLPHPECPLLEAHPKPEHCASKAVHGNPAPPDSVSSPVGRSRADPPRTRLTKPTQLGSPEGPAQETGGITSASLAPGGPSGGCGGGRLLSKPRLHHHREWKGRCGDGPHFWQENYYDVQCPGGNRWGGPENAGGEGEKRREGEEGRGWEEG